MKIKHSPDFYRLLTLYLSGFLLIFGYAFARPCIDSMFLEHYSNDDLPHAWLITSVIMVFVVACYNRLNQRFAILPLFGALSLVSALILALLLLAYYWGFVAAIFVLFIWKELYMVVLMETYWSFADIVFSTTSARENYGLTMGIGSVGGILGNLAVGPTARLIGTNLALCLLLIFLCGGFLIAYLGRNYGDEKPSEHKEKTVVGIGIKVMWFSRYLMPLGLLVCLAQMVTGLIDYSFSGYLQAEFSNLDLRTQALGNIHATVNIIGVSLQLGLVYILRWFGLGFSFRSVPFLLSVSILLFLISPCLALMIAVKISIKSLDYSLLRGIKEILYIPLSRAEKTQGKGIIDIFIYRLARGFSSLLLMLLGALSLSAFVMEFTLAIAGLWLILAIIVTRRYHDLVREQKQEERQEDSAS